jgi:hypothetical protein
MMPAQPHLPGVVSGRPFGEVVARIERRAIAGLGHAAPRSVSDPAIARISGSASTRAWNGVR